jgi:predicted SnoaL-like aldol condensation-catalyzing enzyme
MLSTTKKPTSIRLALLSVWLTCSAACAADQPERHAAASTPAATALQPALPVEENPDHEALLHSADPRLAANKRLVYDMWRHVLEARDPRAAERYIAPDYIQHNPLADTGRDGLLAFISSLGPQMPVQPRVQTKLVAILAERDYVAWVSVDARTQPRPYTTTWFDLFRIDGDQIVEHWDHGQLPADASPRDYVPPMEITSLDGQLKTLKSSDSQLADNKRLVFDAWRVLLDAQQVEDAPRYLAVDYAQHNPLANTGLAGFQAFFRQFAQPKDVQPTVQRFVQLIAEGDLVVLATVATEAEGRAEPYTTTWFDMFRVADAKLVEHWDTATLP